MVKPKGKTTLQWSNGQGRSSGTAMVMGGWVDGCVWCVSMVCLWRGREVRGGGDGGVIANTEWNLHNQHSLQLRQERIRQTELVIEDIPKDGFG